MKDDDKVETEEVYGVGSEEPAMELSVQKPRGFGKSAIRSFEVKADYWTTTTPEEKVEEVTDEVRNKLNNVMTDDDIEDILGLLGQLEKLVENEMELSSDKKGLDAQTVDGKSKSTINTKYGRKTMKKLGVPMYRSRTFNTNDE